MYLLKRLLLLLFVFNTLFLYSNSESYSLEIIIDNLKNQKGFIRISLFNKSSSEYFPSVTDKAYKIYKFDIKKNKSKFILNNIPIGQYAVSVHHDEDGNNELNTNWFGMPKEGLGVSNNARGNFGPPEYSQAEFKHNKNNKLNIKLYYP